MNKKLLRIFSINKIRMIWINFNNCNKRNLCYTLNTNTKTKTITRKNYYKDLNRYTIKINKKIKIINNF